MNHTQVEVSQLAYEEETEGVGKARLEYMNAMREYQKLRTTSDWTSLITIKASTKFDETA
jgi:hypothetical protein